MDEMIFVRKSIKKILFAPLVFGTTLVQANEFDHSHVVKKTETLSDILYAKNLKPIFGKSGYLKQVLALNPEIGNEHSIYPGQHIVLPKVKSEVDSSPEPELPQTIPEIKQYVNETRTSHSNIEFSLSSRFVKVKSNDFSNGSQATVLSDSGRGYNLSWGQNWSDKLDTYFNFENYQVQILDSSTPGKSLSNTTQSLTSYAFGLSQVLTPKTRFLFSLNYGESIVFRAESSSSIVIEKFLSAKFNPGISYTLLARDELKLYSLINLIVALPSTQETYSSELSYGHKLGLGVEDRLGIFKMKVELFYNTLELKMSESSFEQTEAGVLLGLNYQFGAK